MSMIEKAISSSSDDIIVPRISRDSSFNNLSQLVSIDIDFVEESLQGVKLSVERLIHQIKEVRIKYDELVQFKTTGGGHADGDEARNQDLLRELKKEVSSLKFKIPFNLIEKSSHLTLPHLNRRPRNARPRLVRTPPPAGGATEANLNLNGQSPPRAPLSQEVELYLYNHNLHLQIRLRCFLIFPEDTIIKRSLILGLMSALVTPENHQEALDDFVAKGFIKPIYKKCNLIVSGYQMPPLVHSFLSYNERYERFKIRDEVHLPKIDGEDIIYNEEKWLHRDLAFLHLGNWQRTATCHIEMPDPDLVFKRISNQYRWRYLSLRGISMITELPESITKLTSLNTLDLKSCHNLESISSGIGNLIYLTHLDMSDCYFLDHMPMSLSQLINLRFLKGFFIGETSKEGTCTLKDLEHFESLIKLTIYTDAKNFPNESELATLEKLKALRKLTISWGGCSVASLRSESTDTYSQTRLSTEKLSFVFGLEKLDLQCVPTTITNSSWLRPDNFKTLKKLYIRGGKFHNLRQGIDKTGNGSIVMEQDQWSVEILCLKYLKNLKMDWDEVKRLFPRLIYLERVECPMLTGLPCDDNGVWMNSNTESPPSS